MSSCTRESVNAITINPTENIYPCTIWDCDKFHKSADMNDILFDSIYFLQIDRIKELIKDIDEKNAMELKRSNHNMLDYIFLHFWSMSLGNGGKYPTLQSCNISVPDQLLDDNDIIAKQKTFQVLEIICSKYPVMITQKHFDEANALGPRAKKVYDMLTKYYVDDPDATDCFLCLSTNTTELIPNTCSCKNKVHLQCLIKLVSETGKKCTVCQKSNNSVICPRGRVIFPKLNIYKQPLLSKYIMIDKKDVNKSLSYAIAYLQIDRVKELLDTMDRTEMENYIKFNAEYFGNSSAVHKKNTIDLADSMYTNFYRSTYPNEFNEIERLLKLKCDFCAIDPNQNKLNQ